MKKPVQRLLVYVVAALVLTQVPVWYFFTAKMSPAGNNGGAGANGNGDSIDENGASPADSDATGSDDDARAVARLRTRGAALTDYDGDNARTAHGHPRRRADGRSDNAGDVREEPQPSYAAPLAAIKASEVWPERLAVRPGWLRPGADSTAAAGTFAGAWRPGSSGPLRFGVAPRPVPDADEWVPPATPVPSPTPVPTLPDDGDDAATAVVVRVVPHDTATTSLLATTASDNGAGNAAANGSARGAASAFFFEEFSPAPPRASPPHVSVVALLTGRGPAQLARIGDALRAARAADVEVIAVAPCAVLAAPIPGVRVVVLSPVPSNRTTDGNNANGAEPRCAGGPALLAGALLHAVARIVRTFVRGSHVVVIGPDAVPAHPSRFVAWFLDLALAPAASSPPLAGCLTAANRSGSLFVVSHGVDVTAGGRNEAVLSHRLGGFSLADLRAMAIGGAALPSPFCYFTRAATLLDFWKSIEASPLAEDVSGLTIVDGAAGDASAATTPSPASPTPVPPSSGASTTDERARAAWLLDARRRVVPEWFYAFAASALRPLPPAQRVAPSLPAVVVGDFPGWAPDTTVTPLTSAAAAYADRSLATFSAAFLASAGALLAELATHNATVTTALLPSNFASDAAAPLPEPAPLAGVHVVWDTFCVACFGFSNEVMHFIRPLERRVSLRSAIAAECYCPGTPRDFSGALARLSQPRGFERTAGLTDAPDIDSDAIVGGNGTTTTTTSSKKNATPAPGDIVIWIAHKDPGSFPSSYAFSSVLAKRPHIVVGRAMYEFTRLPSQWPSHSSDVDEIWVPSRFTRLVFKTNGFEERKLFVMPEPVDVFFFDPAAARPLQLPVRASASRPWRHASNVAVLEASNTDADAANTAAANGGVRSAGGPVRGDAARVNRRTHREAPRAALARHYKFLSVFKWEERKGWDVLLRSYFAEFAADEPVSLYIVSYIYGDDSRNARRMLELVKRVANKVAEEREEALLLAAANGNNNSSITGGGNHTPSVDSKGTRARGYRSGKRQKRSASSFPNVPHVEIISERLSEDEMVSLYGSCDAFVLPTRGEGWGLPIIQAMSMGLPTIATNWSGNVDFMSEATSYPLRVDALEEVPGDADYGAAVEGKVWAQPSAAHLRTLMRQVFTHRAEAAAVGAAARRHIVAHYSDEVIAEKVVARLRFLKERYLASMAGEASKVPSVRSGVDALLEDHHLIV